jgi:hypothetical protein
MAKKKPELPAEPMDPVLELAEAIADLDEAISAIEDSVEVGELDEIRRRLAIAFERSHGKHPYKVIDATAVRAKPKQKAKTKTKKRTTARSSLADTLLTGQRKLPPKKK